MPTLQFAWNEEMSVGIPEVDEDHKRFISLINDLNRSIMSRMASSEIKQYLQAIIDDAEKHFAKEEVLFKEWQYPDAEGHAKIHAKVLHTLDEIKKQFIPYGHDSDWVDAGVKIKKLLVDHILKEDMKYADYYRNSVLPK
jgi:hemerythrin-like metal-binding protein